MSLSPTLRDRLRSQLEAVVTILGGASPESVSRPSRGGKWSAHENLAHLARHHEVMLEFFLLHEGHHLYPAMLRAHLA